MSVLDTLEYEQSQEDPDEFEKRNKILFMGKKYTHSQLHRKVLRKPRLFLIVLGNIVIITLVMFMIFIFTFIFDLILFK